MSNKLRVLVACEFSGRVRDAFIALGHNAISVDPLPTEQPGPHYQGTIEDFLASNCASDFDLMLAFPPCTYLASSGALYWASRQQEQLNAIAFVRYLLGQPIEHIVLENPVGKISTVLRKPNQVIQPYEHGHTDKKATCLWTKNLPSLRPTNIIPPECRTTTIADHPGTYSRKRNRSRTYIGIARAMAKQYSAYILEQRLRRA